MKVVFERKKEPEKDLPAPAPPNDDEQDFKPVSERKVVSIRSQPAQSIPPPAAPPNDLIELFKKEYMGVFGMDSITASSGDVLMLNLLFAIYGELVSLHEDLTKEGD